MISKRTLNVKVVFKNKEEVPVAKAMTITVKILINSVLNFMASFTPSRCCSSVYISMER